MRLQYRLNEYHLENAIVYGRSSIVLTRVIVLIVSANRTEKIFP